MITVAAYIVVAYAVICCLEFIYGFCRAWGKY